MTEIMSLDLDSVIDALRYQDGERRLVTQTTISLIKAASETATSGDAVFLGTLLNFIHFRDAKPFLIEAEEQGCNHPALYDSLARCYQAVSNFQDFGKALEYYCKAIGGMLPQA